MLDELPEDPGVGSTSNNTTRLDCQPWHTALAYTLQAGFDLIGCKIVYNNPKEPHRRMMRHFHRPNSTNMSKYKALTQLH